MNDHVAKMQCKEGVALLKLGLIEPKDLFEALREQLRRRMIECFGWADGEFELEADDERSEQIQPFRIDPYRLVQEGLQNHWGLERMLAGLHSQMERYPRPADGLAKDL